MSVFLFRFLFLSPVHCGVLYKWLSTLSTLTCYFCVIFWYASTLLRTSQMLCKKKICSLCAFFQISSVWLKSMELNCYNRTRQHIMPNLLAFVQNEIIILHATFFLYDTSQMHKYICIIQVHVHVYIYSTHQIQGIRLV